MRAKATLAINKKETFNDGSIVQIVVWDLPVPLMGSRHRYKYSLYFGKNGVCLVRYDNERGKGDHRHIDGKEEEYSFVNISSLLADFWNDVERMGG